MDHSIPSVAPVDRAPSVGLLPRERSSAWIALMGRARAAAPPPPGDARSPGSATAPIHRDAPEPVQPGDFGRAGRFEKFILALQALRIDLGGVASRTDRVERMRAAAEELFGIDGVPQPVRPLAGPTAEPAPGVDPQNEARASAADARTDQSEARRRLAPAPASSATGGGAAPGEASAPAAPSAADPPPGDGAPSG